MFGRPAISQKDKKHIGLKFEKMRIKIDGEYQNKLREKQTELGNGIHGGSGQNELISIKIEKIIKLAEAWSDIYREVCGNPASEKDVNIIVERVKQVVDAHIKSLISDVKNNTIIPGGSKQGFQQQLISSGMSIMSSIRTDLRIYVMENKFTLRKRISRCFTMIKKNFTMNNPWVWISCTIIALVIVAVILKSCFYINDNKSKSQNIISHNQQGGITAKNVTINAYLESPSFISKKQKLISNLRQKYPFGFVIFSVDYKNIVIPNNLNFAQDFNIDWVNTKIKQLTNDKIEILMPKIFYKPQGCTIQEFTMTIPRKVGYKKAFPISFGSQKFKPIFEILEDHSRFLILVIGFK
ncbi:MAG: hypothetical protein P9L95_10605 [Candidatus Tenebribacter mawsonii]|nr:hypothetical protein [Candidatus Tenebribacter mawsonii]